jgi:hypothetical protein
MAAPIGQMTQTVAAITTYSTLHDPGSASPVTEEATRDCWRY